MSAPINVKVAAAAIAAGFVDRHPGRARITVTLHPSAGDGPVDLREWPSWVRTLKNFRLRIARPADKGVAPTTDLQDSIPLRPVVGLADGPHPNATALLVQALWQRSLAPGPGAITQQDQWDALAAVVHDMTKPSSDDAGRIIVPPTHMAALAYPFERGRLALEALARDGSRPNGRDPIRPSQPAAVTGVRFAELDHPTTASDAIATMPSATARREFAGRPGSRAVEVARAAMGHYGGLRRVIEDVHAAHRAATPDRCSSPDPQISQGDTASDAAKRRLGGLLGAPVLQRLFGLALDFDFDLEALKVQSPADGTFLLVAVAVDDDGPTPAAVTPLWTLTKVRIGPAGDPGYFGPASWAEQKWMVGGWQQELRPATVEGMEVLDLEISAGHPKFALATVDPELAIEGDLANPEPKGRSRGTLRSGGLRLLDVHAETSVQAENAQREQSRQRALATSTSSHDVVQDAEDMQPMRRLDLGLDTGRGPAWRCAGYRIVRYHDPCPGSPPDWVEKELTRLLGPPNGPRRIELDAATVSRSSMKVQPGSHDEAPHLPDPTKHPNLYASAKRDAEKDSKTSDATYGNTVTIAGATVAAWGGEPMGSPTVRSDCPAGDELAISRMVSLPSSLTGDAEALLALPMRFGWPYRVGIRQVFPGGVCLPLPSAAWRYAQEDGHECLPSRQRKGRRQDGRRLLRHERVEAPLVALLGGDAGDQRGKMPKQGAAQAIVRTAPSPDLAIPRIARRILAAPNVPLHFATLHDVFRGWRPERGSTRTTPPGGPLDGHITGGGDGEPLQIDVDHRVATTKASKKAASRAASEPVYPDPAASLMVLRLRSPLGPDAWLEEPVVVPIQEQWPNGLPVLVELHASGAFPGPRLGYDGVAPIGGMRTWVTGSDLKAHKVEARLRPAEDLVLDAWCVPTIDQLVTWFDAVESAAVLAAHDGGAPHDPDRTCGEALARLVGKPIGSSAPLPDACVAGGGLAAPSRGTLRALAAMLHQTMLRRPIVSLAGVQSLRLTHAVALPQATPRLEAAGASKLALARRLFAGGDAVPGGATMEARLDFISKVPTGRWTETASEEGATAVLFGGALDVDLASTASIELEVECADPGTNKLDDPDHHRRPPDARASGDWSALKHDEPLSKLFGFEVARDRRVTLARRTVVPLRIDGLPAPTDGAPGRHRLTLESLQAASWAGTPGATAKPGAAAPALRVVIDTVFATTGARLLKVTPVATGRHANLMHPDKATPSEKHALNAAAVKGESIQIWLPATERPAPPVIHDVEVRFGRTNYQSLANGSKTVGVRQATHIRVRLARPWYSSGEGERLGLVLWPPSIFFQNPPSADESGRPLPPTISDLDLGPVGPFITRWAADSSDAPGNWLDQLVPATAFTAGDDDPAFRVTAAFMPLPSKTAASAELTQACPAEPGQGKDGQGKKDDDQDTSKKAFAAGDPPPDFAAVALLTAEPRFDVEQELWFVDLELHAEELFDPYLRLGLVRYQPNAREDAVPPEGEEPVRLRVSTPVSAPARVLPTRAAEVTWRKGARGGTDVYVTVRVSRPVAGNGDGPGAAVRVRLLARRKDAASLNGQQVTAFGTDGRLCVWESWSGSEDGTMTATPGATAFTCLFNLPGEAEDDRWSHVGVVETFSRRPPANYPNEPVPDGDATLIESGPDFHATLELTTDGGPRPSGSRLFARKSEKPDRADETVP